MQRDTCHLCACCGYYQGLSMPEYACCGLCKSLCEEPEQKRRRKAGVRVHVCSTIENQKWEMLQMKENPLKYMDLCVSQELTWKTSSLEEILRFLEDMPTLPTVEKMVLVMQKCTKEKNLLSAKRISVLIHNHGLVDNLSLGNHLVQMLAACQGLHDAQDVFDRLPRRKEYAWASLIQAYSNNGDPHRTLYLFDKMQEELVRPAMYTYPAVLKACARLKQMDKGRTTHADIVIKGFDSDLFVGNSLVDLYAKCGSLADAREVFKQHIVKTTVSWNAMITGYADLGLGKEALACLEHMQAEGWSPDAGTFVCSLKACGIGGAISKNRELHSWIVKEGWDRVLLVGNSLVDMYAKCGMLEEAQKALEHLPSQSLISWTALISGYAEHGPALEALNCYKKMQREGLYPDDITFVCSLKACGSIGAIQCGREVHSEAVKAGLEREFLIGNILVDMYAKCRSVEDTRKIFDELSVRNVVSWTALIAGLTEYGHCYEALILLKQMREEGIMPNAATYTCSLKACGNIGAIDQGQNLHAGIAGDQLFMGGIIPGVSQSEHNNKDGSLEASQEKLAGALVDMYSRCGCIIDSKKVFDAMSSINLVICNALITGFSRQGESRVVFEIVFRMRMEKLVLDGVTFLGLLTVCSHAGLCDIAFKYFEDLNTEYISDLTVEHCNCIIDLFGRIGQLDEARAMLEKMPFQPNLVSLGSMLSGCRNGDHVELGRHALECAAALGSRDLAPALISMSNIYATAHMWEDVETIKVIIQAWKDP